MAVTDLASIQPEAVPAVAEALSDAALGYAREAHAENTRRTYRTAWQDFATWCAAEGCAALPATPATVGNYLSARAATHKVASLRIRLVAIRQAHVLAGHSLDAKAREISTVLRGLIRRHGTAPRKAKAATIEIIRDAVRVLEKTPGLRPLRDRALLLVGFAGAFRRSELVALDMADVAFTADGMMLTIRRAKTDQEGQGATLGVPFGRDPLTCPIATLRAWLDAAEIETGPLFRPINKAGRVLGKQLSDGAVAAIVKAAVAGAGYEAEAAAYSGHSLRSGFCTSAAWAGVPEAHIQRQSRHKSLPVLRGYIQQGSVFLDNAAARVGL